MKTAMFKKLIAAAAPALALSILSACGGGGAGSAAPPTSPVVPQSQMVSVQFQIAIPQSVALSPKYVSSSTQSAKITVTPTGSAPLAPVTVNCTSTCSATVQAPVGSDSFTVSLYDTAGGTGNMLSQGAMTQTILAGQANTVNLTFGGVVASIVINLASTTVSTAGSIPVTVTAKDAANQTIVGSANFSNPITLSDNDSSGHTSLSASAVTSPLTAVNLVYDGDPSFVSAVINAAASGVTKITTATLTKSSAGGTCTSGTIRGYYPCNLQAAYSLPSATAGTGQTVAVVDAHDDPNAEADLGVYRAQFGLPACTTANGCFKKIDQSGGSTYPTADMGWAEEISLDLDMVSAVCPNCNILLVEATTPSTGSLGKAVNQAVKQGANVVSNSYGGDESSSEANYDTQYFQHPGVVITASSGDSGYIPETCDGSGPGVCGQYPAASPYVIAVGGTALTPSATSRGFTESAWNDNTWDTSGTHPGGAGSFCSMYEAKPAFQVDTGCTGRAGADISAVADPNTGVAVYDTYLTSFRSHTGWAVFGGTSASAPIVGAAFALAGNTASINDASGIYSHAIGITDVVSGDNIVSATCTVLYLCHAGVGYDGPTGMGTPTGTAALSGIRSPQNFARGGSISAGQVHPGPSKRVCSAPRPGYMACDAMIRTDE